MNRKKIIGIPIKNLENPMSRLSEILTQEERIHTQKELIPVSYTHLTLPTNREV